MELKTSYLDLATKAKIIDEICKTSIQDNDGYITINPMSKLLAIDLSLLQFYSDVDINTADTDSLYKEGKIKELRNLIPEEELYYIETMVDITLAEMKESHNSLGAVINRNMVNLVNKVPQVSEIQKLLPKLGKQLSKIDPQTMEILKNLGSGNIK